MFEFSNSGSRIREIRSPVIKDGKFSVEVVGEEDLQDYINSFADTCDVELLVSRAVNGEPELLNRRQVMYGDFSSLPKTYAEFLQNAIGAKNVFESLPVEQRAFFNNDVFEFIAKLDDKDALIKAGLLKEEKKEEGSESK